MRILETRSSLMSTLTAASLLLAGCATLGTIPGVSLIVDATEASKLAEALDNDELTEAQAQESMNRPMPPPPGLSFEVAALRRMLAAVVLGNEAVLAESYGQMRRHGKSPALKAVTGSVMATAEITRGNLSAALVLFDEIERERRATPGRPAGSAIASTMDASTVALHMDGALGAGRVDVAERLLREYYQPTGGRNSMTAYQSAMVQAHGTHFRGRIAELRGDILGARTIAAQALEETRAIAARFPSLGDRERNELDRRLIARLAALSRVALMINDFGLARSNLQEIRDRVAATGNKRLVSIALRQAEADYYAALGRFDEAARANEAVQRDLPVVVRKSPYVKAGLGSMHAAYLLSAGRHDDARMSLEGVASVRQLPPSDVSDSYWMVRALANALSGRPGAELREFDAIEPRIANRRDSLMGLGFFGIKSLVYQRRGAAQGSEADLLKAIDGGRQFARAYRASRATGAGRNLAFHEPTLRQIKESYLAAASAMVGRGGVTFDDLIDAAALAQESETDEDIGAAVARQRTLSGVTELQLRQLQNLQQLVRGSQRQLQDLARAADADPGLLDSIARSTHESSQRLNSLLLSLRQSAPNVAQVFSSTAPQLAEIQGRLGAGESLAVFVPIAQQTLAIHITRTTARHRILQATRLEQRALVKRIRDSTDFDRRLPFDSAAARELHRALFGWLGQTPEPVAMSVVTSGELASIPFALLIADDYPAGKDNDYRALPWLARTTAIAHAPSVASWYGITGVASPVAAEGYIAWADPKFNEVPIRLCGPAATTVAGQAARRASVRSATQATPTESMAEDLGPQLEELCEARDEALRIARVVGGSAGIDVIAGAGATRTSVMTNSESGLLERKRVVLFATHGLAPGTIAGLDQPALAMAREPGARRQPSLLRLDDVVGLRMNAEWLLLSACDTASADREGGDALSGLARGFFFAGARSMLVTHWPVETVSAAEITTRTIARYAARPQLTRAQALREAILELLDGKVGPADAKWSHPAFWAPYALVGDGRRATARR